MQFQDDNGKVLIAANNQPLRTLGKVTVTVKIGNFNTLKEFSIKRNLAYPCILGNDFNKKYNIDINFKNNQFSVENHVSNDCEISHNKQVANQDSLWNPLSINDIHKRPIWALLTDDVSLKPKESRVINIRVKSKLNKTLLLCEPNEGYCKTHHLLVNNTVYKGRFPRKIYVQNLSYTPIRLFKGDKIASVHTVQRVNTLSSLNTEEKSTAPVKHTVKDLNINPNLPQNERENLEQILEQFMDCFAWGIEDITQTNVAELTIDVQGHPPISQPPYRVSMAERQIIKNQCKEMLEHGIIEHSNSNWSSPVLLVKKQNGSTRFCCDFRKINRLVKADKFPIPRIDDILSSLNNTNMYTLLDLNNAFWSLPVKKEDRDILAFCTPDDLYTWKVAPYGLKTSPIAFQRLVNKVLAPLLWHGVVIYFDDCLIMSQGATEHNKRLIDTLTRLRDANLKLQPKKCTFGYTEIKMLGHIVDSQGSRPDPNKTKSISEFPTPRRPKDVKSFLGMCQFFKKFIANYSHIASPLTLLLRKNIKFEWKEEQENAFQTLKNKLMTSPVLRHFQEGAPIEIRVDACGHGVAGVLLQKIDGHFHPIQYCSRKLSDAELSYDTTNKEMLSLVYSLQQFRPFVYGRDDVTVLTDHHALCFMHNMKPLTGRLGRYVYKLQDFNFKIKHRKGCDHGEVDCLSRYPVSDANEEEIRELNDIPTFAITQLDMAAEQNKDNNLRVLKQTLLDPGRATPTLYRKSRSYLVDKNILYRKNVAHAGRPRLIVLPKHLITKVLYANHDDCIGGGHLGYARTLSKIRRNYFWEDMNKHIMDYCRSCPDCQSRKRPIRQPQGHLTPTPAPPENFYKISVDICGPFPRTYNNNRYIVAAIDFKSKYLILKAIPSGNAKEIALFLLENVILIHSCVREILTDRGAVFKSELVTEILRLMGIRNQYTLSYFAAQNGQIERTNATVVTMLSMYIETSQKNWDQYVPMVQFSYNVSKQEVTGMSPFSLVYNREPVLPVDMELLPPTTCKEAQEIVERINKTRKEVSKRVLQAQSKQKQRFDTGRSNTDYKVGELVKVFIPVRSVGRSTKLTHRWFGNYKVIKKLSDNNYIVQIKRGNKIIEDIAHVTKMKRYYTPKYNLNDSTAQQ